MMSSLYVKCSFCGKAEVQVVHLIKGPGVNICNECVALCDDILRQRPQAEADLGGGVTFEESFAVTAEETRHSLSTMLDRAARAVESSDPGLALELRAAAKRVGRNGEDPSTTVP